MIVCCFERPRWAEYEWIDRPAEPLVSAIKFEGWEKSTLHRVLSYHVLVILPLFSSQCTQNGPTSRTNRLKDDGLAHTMTIIPVSLGRSNVGVRKRTRCRR